ncbi:MAG: SCO family protein [Steroidobacteraceae bacterium]
MTPKRHPQQERRAVLRSLVCLPAAASFPCAVFALEQANVHDGPIVPPVTVPDARLQLADGRRVSLRELLSQKVTALQLVFTHCTTTCPMQAAIFQRVQRLFPEHVQEGAQLLSLSIDPAQDTAAQLRAWLERFGARQGWVAAVPEAMRLPQLLQFFGTRADSFTSHATQVQIIDRHACLMWRTNELPSAQSVVKLLRAGTDPSMSRMGSRGS